ncbi:MAG: pyridoxamine 5'-phosphate oxidase family protein [Chloroflexi bacterium]|jgi:hypothetical protein|nr:pyridoxamine 5'-phosphate oxidase family protein [Chloroflexota bacterium]
MAPLPDVVLEAWKERKAPVVLTTVDTDGVPNAIYASCARLWGTDRIVVADNYFNKTLANIKSGSKGSLLFITEERKAYQVKGTLEYLTSGEIYEDMLTWVDPKHPRRAAAVLHVEQVYNGATRLL